MARIAKSDLSLHDTLLSGQTFSWHFDSKRNLWQGWIDTIACTAWEEGRYNHFEGPTQEQVETYFSLDLNWEEIHKSFPKDEILLKAVKKHHRIKIVREPWWECTCNFVCSSLKQVVQIQQINQNLRKAFGKEVSKGRFNFPSSKRIAQLEEEDLRACRLGYRAKHLHIAAKQIEQGDFCFEEELENVSVHEAEKKIQKLRGVGNKVANCILLYTGKHLDAFPIDVWMERVLSEHYFSKSQKMPNRMYTLDFMRGLFWSLLRDCATISLSLGSYI